MAAYGELHGIKLGLENDGPYTNKLDIQLEVIGKVNAPMLGTTFNPANYLAYGNKAQNLPRIAKKLAHHVVHTHLTDCIDSVNDKSQTLPVPLGDGRVEVDTIVKHMLDAGYSGDFLVDYRGSEAPEAACQASYRCIRSHLPRRIYSYA